jgi:hypothetical protein
MELPMAATDEARQLGAASPAAASKTATLPAPSQQTEHTSSARGRGRPSGHAGGKRDDDTYTQASAYIPKVLHRKVKAALILEEKPQDYSELVEELLTGWLASRSRIIK